jgi:hypothetical protein
MNCKQICLKSQYAILVKEYQIANFPQWVEQKKVLAIVQNMKRKAVKDEQGIMRQL